jgi:DNA mismatch repair protein MutL
MGRVRVLPPEVANQIAAGEVVERPASIVKELVENALDAGAARIAVAIEGGGADLVEVADDGAGMDREDALLACERHATSKVSAATDLLAIRSYGFRGEALPSIASVSRLSLATSTGGGEGVRIRIEGGRLVGADPAPHPRGTTVRVQDLFFNAPARRKFLRAPGTEAAHVVENLARLGASHPGIDIRLTSGGREQFHWPAVSGVGERVAAILGPTEAGALVPIARSEGRLSVLGLASSPALDRATARDEYLYVNSRPIRDRRLLHAVHAAYATLLPRGRFPVVFLFLEMPLEEVDVNVHPAKAEVRFHRAGAVHDLVLRALREGLTTARPFAALADRPLVEDRFAVGEPGTPALPMRPALSATTGGAAATPRQGEMATATTLADLGASAAPKALAQYAATWIVAESPEGLVIVDQHAAHERVLYERLLAGAERGKVERQRLLFPLVLEVPAAQLAGFDACADLLQSLGFGLAPFGAGTLRLDETPALVPADAVERLVREVLAESIDRERPRAAVDLKHRIVATTACHAAVRAGAVLSVPRMDRILEELMAARSPMTCPHGRPTLLRLGIDRLEREFGRR